MFASGLEVPRFAGRGLHSGRGDEDLAGFGEVLYASRNRDTDPRDVVVSSVDVGNMDPGSDLEVFLGQRGAEFSCGAERTVDRRQCRDEPVAHVLDDGATPQTDT